MKRNRFYPIAKGIVNVIFRIFFRVRYVGRENIPEQGKGFVLCSNHVSVIDPIFVALPVKQQIHFMAKAELFKVRPFGLILRHLNAFPVSRGAGDFNVVDHAKNVVQEGRVLGVFPEGTRSKDGKLLKLKSGALVVAAQTGANILPVSITCEKSHKPKLFRKVYITYGKLIENAELGLEEGARSTRQIKGAKQLVTARMEALLEAKPWQK